MARKDDPFGNTTFIRLEVHNMGYGYNIDYVELPQLEETLVENPTLDFFLRLKLLSGETMWIRAKNISDFSISTPKSREFNKDIEDKIEATKKEEEWD